MTMKHDEMITVIQAHKDGKKIEYKSTLGREAPTWIYTAEPAFNFYKFDYRVMYEHPLSNVPLGAVLECPLDEKAYLVCWMRANRDVPPKYMVRLIGLPDGSRWDDDFEPLTLKNNRYLDLSNRFPSGWKMVASSVEEYFKNKLGEMK